jgi:short-subunit dehydrogenase
MSISKKNAIVTGASTGLGKHLSIELSQNNYHVFLIARNIEKLEIVKENILDSGGDCSIFAADISNDNDVDKISEVVDKIAQVDVLVNNAGIGIFNKIENTSVDEWDKHISVNLRGSFLMSKMVVPNMKKNKSGKIVFINSVAGLHPYPYSSAYVASKFGLTGFSSSLREELRESNIKVLSYHPGAIDTPFWNNSKTDFPRTEMLSSKDVAESIVSSILAKKNIVHEQVIIRRTAGDF